MLTCGFRGCGRRLQAQGLCMSHYKQSKLFGRANLVEIRPRPDPDPESLTTRESAEALRRSLKRAADAYRVSCGLRAHLYWRREMTAIEEQLIATTRGD